MALDFLEKTKVTKWAFVGAIIIVLNLFFIFGIKLIYTEPQVDHFCENPQVKIIPQTKDECIAVGGQWSDDQFIQKGLPRPTERLDVPVIETVREGYCDPEYTCRKEYDAAHMVYERNMFVALVILGALTIIAGYFLHVFEVVATAFSFGGVLTLTVASVRYWSNMDEYVRVIVLGFALIALIWVGMRKFSEK